MAAFKPATVPACCSALALSVFMTGSAAFADVTASQIWADWQAYMESSGYAITGQEQTSGDTLTVSDITMTMAIPEEDGTVTIGMGQIAFEERGDGTVAVIFPESLPITVAVEGSDTEEVLARIDYLSTALDMVASGDPDNIRYNYTADEIAIELRDVTIEDEQMDLGTMRFAMADIEGSSSMELGNLRRSAQNVAAGPLTYTVDVTDPEGDEGRLFLNGQLDSFALEAAIAMPLEMDGTDMATAIANGFDAEGVMTYQTGATEFSFEEDGETVEGTSSSDSGEFAFALGEDGLVYALGAEAMKMMMAGGEIPFPIELAMEEIGFNLSMPVTAGDEAQDFALGLRMAEFTMSDILWSIFDPQGQLPRDPATIDIDTTGSATLAVNVLDPEAMEDIEMPGELNALDLNALVLRAAGAELTGQGSFTFDNSDMQTFDGFPAPDGSVDLRLQGANGLLDTLIAMGYLPEDQAMGVRMMMGMFAVPGDGEDVLNSTIEVRPGGQVLANGQRLR